MAAAGEAEMAPAHGDRAGGDEDHLLAAGAATRDIVGECCEPRGADLTTLCDQERRADLDDEPPGRRDRRRWRHSV